MDYHEAFRISASGMAVEKARLDTTAMNIANMNTSAPADGKGYRPLRVVARAEMLSFSEHYRQQATLHGGGVSASTVAVVDGAPRMEYDPQHPDANKDGFVAFAGVNHANEMLTMNSALRAHEANVVALNAAKTMASRALTIGD